MFAGSFRQLGHNCRVTGTAGVRRRIRGKDDVPWLMNRVALETERHCLPFGMRLVTGETGRLEAV